MSKVYTDPQNYTDIANAIRYKNGTATQYKPQNMAEAIRAIPTGGGEYDFGINIEEPTIEIDQNLNNWSWNADSGILFPNTYNNGINTVSGYVGGNGYERMRKTISGLLQYTWYIFTFNFCSPSGFSDGNYGDPFACAINTTSPSRPDGTRALNEYFDYINGMTRRFNNQASNQMNEYHIIFNTRNLTQANISLEFGSITDGVSADFKFSDFVLAKITEIKKNV